MDQRSVHQHLSHHEVDQRSVHQHLHQPLHDQRLMQVQVGVDPEAVIQRFQEAERQTQTVISEARSEISNTQRVADQTVHNVVLEARSHISEAQAQAQSTETKAQAYVNELKAKHQKELEEVQRVAQRVHDDYQASQNQLGIANDKINELLHTIGRQSEDLERQRKEQSGLTQQVLELQHQVTLIRQSASPSPVQKQNATVIDMSPVMKEVQSLRNELSLLRKEPQSHFPIAVAMTTNASLPTFPAAQPISPAASACAGFPDVPIPHVRKPGQDSWSASVSTMPKPSGSDRSSSSSESGGGGGHPDGGWSPPHHGSSGGGNSPGGFTPNQGGYMPNRSVGIGSNAVAMTERGVHRIEGGETVS